MDHPVTSTRSGDGLENSLADTREPGRELVSSERVWSGPIFAVDADQVRLGPGQKPVARQVVVHHDAVAVVALREGEASSQAARGLAEETDYEAATWHTLAEFYASPGFTTEGARIFLAQDLSLLPEDRRTVREDEEAEFVPTWGRLDEALDAVVGGRLHNPSTVLGVLATAQARSRGWAGLRPADAPWLRSPESL